jgi:hypothetical protein
MDFAEERMDPAVERIEFHLRRRGLGPLAVADQRDLIEARFVEDRPERRRRDGDSRAPAVPEPARGEPRMDAGCHRIGVVSETDNS